MHEARRHKIPGKLLRSPGSYFVYLLNMFQLKRSGTSWENCFGGNSFLQFPQFVRLDLEISIYKLILERNNINLAE